MIPMALFSSIFATAICVMVAAGHFFGFCEPNVCDGESLLLFYVTLWASVAVPTPVVFGSLGLIQVASRRLRGV